MNCNTLLTQEEAAGSSVAPLVKIRDEFIDALGIDRDVFVQRGDTDRYESAPFIKSQRVSLYRELYHTAGLSLRRVAMLCGVDHRTVRRDMLSSGIPTRKRQKNAQTGAQVRTTLGTRLKKSVSQPAHVAPR